jgi:chromosome segregation ATPase
VLLRMNMNHKILAADKTCCQTHFRISTTTVSQNSKPRKLPTIQQASIFKISSSAASIIDKAYTAHAILKIDEAKQLIETFQMEYETLHAQIDSLRQVKESLTETVVSLETKLEELQDQFAEIPQEIPTACVNFDAGQDSQDTFWETPK